MWRMMRCWSKEAARSCGISPCSISVTLQPFSESRRAATMPAAPAPTTMTRNLSSLGEGEAQSQADEDQGRKTVEPAAEPRGALEHAGSRPGRNRDDAIHRRAADVEDEAEHQDLHHDRAAVGIHELRQEGQDEERHFGV